MSTPNGPRRPTIATDTPLSAPSSSDSADCANRCSVVPVLNYDGGTGHDRVARLRPGAGRNAQSTGPFLVPDAAPPDERVLILEEFEHARDLDAEALGGGRHRLVHQLGSRRALQRVLAEAGDRGLLGGTALELGLSSFALGDFRDHAVPPVRAVGLADEDRVVPDPYAVAVTVTQPVLGGDRLRGPVVNARPRLLTGRGRLAAEHPGPVVRM